MTRSFVFVLAGTAFLAACGEMTPGEEQDGTIRIDCGDTDVLVSEAQAEAFLAGTGETYGTAAAAVCASVTNVDASTYADPTEATIYTANGAAVDVLVQTSQQ
ncbi:hypothetical protein R5H30_11370 [Sulfitobacter sp. D35]|uniref:hypothetical protein n=1 Tax=Sulfitobacter sp. D35 TaxID=3083252 RepID=UPI00296F2E8A|nr:hypothetical protein [Sulfitobacter sp. D35]MDW4498584.1 hypothetical protein [Sulfitobacter sp. D35]